VGLKAVYAFAAITGIVLALCFGISTLGFTVSDPSIGLVKIVRYGFPASWLRAVIPMLPPGPPQYLVLWPELLVDVSFWLAVSLALALLTMRAAKREAPATASLSSKLLLVVLVAYPTRVLACAIHEFLGHGLWAWVFGAYHVQVYVSWLGFGWCRAQGMNDAYLARVLFSAGGLLNTFLIGAVILAFLYLAPHRGGFYLRFSLFWMGFWAAINQASYLLLGGVTGYGDPGALSALTGVSLAVFVALGVGLFLAVYVAVSVLFLSEVTRLFPEYRAKTLLFAFWLSIPFQVVLFTVSPQHAVSTSTFVLLLVTSTLPSLLAPRLFPLFHHLSIRAQPAPT
jgi:hypothetical protein